MANNTFLQSIEKFFKIGDKEIKIDKIETTNSHDYDHDHDYRHDHDYHHDHHHHHHHHASNLLMYVKFMKSELDKLAKTGKSTIADLNAVKAEIIPTAQVLCNFAITKLTGNPVNDRTSKSEQIFVLLYTLPPGSRFGALMSKILVGTLWHELPHPPANFQNQAGYQWRSADGSNNNFALPNIGKAGEKYIQDCPSRRLQSTSLPDPGLIFDELLKRTPGNDGQFKANPFGISSNLFYFATLITHDIFHTNHMDPSINLTTSYLDLSSLYGPSKQTQDSIRTGNNGLLKVDRFVETRFWMQPGGLTAFLVLFNRNHNYLAEKLLEIDENYRFSSLNDKQRDEALFQTARLINERTYVNIILHDYIRVILGINRTQSSWALNPAEDFTNVGSGGNIPIATGNQCSLEFSFLYRWHHGLSIEDEQWVNEIFTSLIGDWRNMDTNTMFRKLAETKSDQKDNLPFVRDKNGRIKDEDLARAIINGCQRVSGAFGGRNTPEIFRNIEIRSISSARKVGMCTLNEFRHRLNLKKYESFNELNSELADHLARLYSTIDDVELYPGLLSEGRKSLDDGGSGLCPNYTTKSAILSDAVALVRGDRFHTKEANHYNLTNFGMQDSQSDGSINYGTLIGRKLIARHLSSIFCENNVYAVFPFVLPEQTRKYLDGKHVNYDFTKPL